MPFTTAPSLWIQISFIALAAVATVWHLYRDGPVMIRIRNDEDRDPRDTNRPEHR